ncbi:MAG: glycoside hydrolase family 16 protein [Saprospiraceae bacterium]|nr:glycoside hydrolase family 16 protein [Saprospiraceae bacterium]
MKFYIPIAVLVAFCLGCASSKSGSGAFRKLVWADEFNYPGLPDSTRWGYDSGDGCPGNCGWGNNEMEFYTVSRSENARVENGHLIIEARKENMGNKKYTSARMVTKNKGDWRYGRMEVRAKLPKGVGIWPAIWMLPTDWEYGGWPRSGEIDIMEFVGYEPDTLYGTIHTESFNHAKGTQKSAALYSGDLSSAFHVYALEWHPDRLDFYLDNRKYHTFRNNGKGIDAWPFDQKFHLILNIAVGGNWGGKKGVDDAIFPQQMLVDYVRVYQ